MQPCRRYYIIYSTDNIIITVRFDVKIGEQFTVPPCFHGLYLHIQFQKHKIYVCIKKKKHPRTSKVLKRNAKKIILFQKFHMYSIFLIHLKLIKIYSHISFQFSVRSILILKPLFIAMPVKLFFSFVFINPFCFYFQD